MNRESPSSSSGLGDGGPQAQATGVSMPIQLDHANYGTQDHTRSRRRSLPSKWSIYHPTEQIVPAELDDGAIKLALEALELAGYASVDKQATLQVKCWVSGTNTIKILLSSRALR